MSKRFIYPQQHGERKKARLDVSISDHNFPLSQNNEPNKESNDADTWGDDNDDEILLLASQACEEAYNDSQLPNYSMFIQPASTSTQLSFQPSPSTSKTEFTFKKPSSKLPSTITTNLKEKCTRISSPLPGISSKVISTSNGQVNVSDDLIFNVKNQDSDYVYRQLLQLQEENAKLKSENGKLLEKCVTKEGEASILRTQLKACQVSVDNVRLEKIRAQEKVQMDWTEKLAAANSQLHDLRNQLDFKNLEIISVKEKCKKLESSKVKLTQVTVGGTDLSTSHRNNNSIPHNDISTTQRKKVKTTTNFVQTDDKAHFLKLNITQRIARTSINSILPLIFEPIVDQNLSILDYNEKLQTHSDLSQNKCRIYSTFHRLPTTRMVKDVKTKVTMSDLYEDVTSLSIDDDHVQQKYFNIFNAISSVLTEVQAKLETLSQRVTTSFQKEMDEKYIEVTSNYLDVSRENLLKASLLYREEQEILARRMVATLSYILETSRGFQTFCIFDTEGTSKDTGRIINIVFRICVLLDSTSCATLYSGLILSIAFLMDQLTASDPHRKNILELLKTILTARPMPFVVTKVLDLVVKVSVWNSFIKTFCPGNSIGNLKTDYDQGVLLYKKDSCFIQILLKQTEMCLKCIEKQNLTERALETTRNLIILYSNINDSTNFARDKSRCDCQLVLVQAVVYALRICAVMLDSNKTNFNEISTCYKELLAVCRCGIQLLYQCGIRNVEFSSQLSHNEGHLIEFCELMRGFDHGDEYANMLSELAGTLQSSPEDMPPSFHGQPWLKSFQSFTLTE